MVSTPLIEQPQKVLLVADLEPIGDTDGSNSMEHQSWSAEIADWEHPIASAE